MSGAPVTLKRGRSQATIVSHVNRIWEVRWTASGGTAPGLGVLNSAVPLQVALSLDEPAEFFYREIGSSADWLPVPLSEIR